MDHSLKDKTVCIAGLGYVGLPLALAFSGHLKTIGFDVDAGKIRELSGVNDNPGIAFTDDPDFFTKNRVKTALRVGFCLFPSPKAQQKRVTVFEYRASAKMYGCLV